jgi:hypothetical protein
MQVYKISCVPYNTSGYYQFQIIIFIVTVVYNVAHLLTSTKDRRLKLKNAWGKSSKMLKV